MATKDTIIEYAQTLFLTLDDKGGKAFSLRDISTEIKRKYHKSIDFSTVANWAKKGGWEALLQAAKNQGAQKEIQQLALLKNASRQEEILDIVSSDIASRRAVHSKVGALALRIITHNLEVAVKKGEETPDEYISVDMKALQTIARQSEDVIQILDGKKEPVASDIPSHIRDILREG